MNRRDLLKNALLAAAQAAVVPTYLLAVEDAEEKYYSAFRERCRGLAEQGYEIKANAISHFAC